MHSPDQYRSGVHQAVTPPKPAFFLLKAVRMLTWGVETMVRKKRPMKDDREYWYMGSTLARSLMQKKSSEDRTATGRYCSLVASMSLSVCSASATLPWISLLVACDMKNKRQMRYRFHENNPKTC